MSERTPSRAPRLIYLAWGFPPAAKSCTYRQLATANSFAAAGWDVTVVTLDEHAWLLENGIDSSTLELVDPRITVERLPLRRADRDVDIRSYSWYRAARPVQWSKRNRKRDERPFPEAGFGRWRDELVAAVRRIHDEDGADLVLASATPYTFFAPALDLWQRSGVPYVLDYRDAWIVDIIRDRPAFSPESRRGRLERELMDHALEAWFVNEPIRDAYAAQYPDRAEDFRVVRNGADLLTSPPESQAEPAEPAEPAGRTGKRDLVFGYLGTMTFDLELLSLVCAGWVLARERDPVLAAARLEFRGHIGTGAARGVGGHARVLAAHADDDVSFAGPVTKAEAPGVYGAWDGLVLILSGGRYVTSGKVYDYLTTGLPILSVHQWDHAATEVLDGYPLWVRTPSLTPEAVATGFEELARVCERATGDDRQAARAHAARFERYAQIEPAVGRVTRRLAGRSSDAAQLGRRLGSTA